MTYRVTAPTPSYIAADLLPGDRQLEKAGIPELIKGDIWSLGLLFHALMTPGSEPFIKEI